MSAVDPSGHEAGWGPVWGPPVPPPGDARAGPDPEPACYQHPDRRASARCRRCDRPICTDCMRVAPVGWQCVTCVHRDSRQAPVTQVSGQWRAGRGGTLGATRVTPVVAAIIAVNVVVFVLEESNFNSVVYRFSLIPAFTQHERYRLITAAFLHQNITHIALNMFTLVVVGPAVEAAIGPLRCLVAYLLAAFGGEVLSYLIGPLRVESVGASGAIFGLMGVYFVLARRRRWDLSLITPLIVVNLVFSFLDPAIDWRVHIGGLVVGAVVAWIYTATESLSSGARLIAQSAACSGVLAGLVLLSLLPPGHVHL